MSATRRRSSPEPIGLKTGPLARNLSITGLGLNVGSRVALHHLRNLFRGADARQAASREFYSRRAEQLAEQLGQLKGGAMKAGQLLALLGEYMLPAEMVQALASLQDFAQPMPWTVVAPVLEKAVGPERLAGLEIDEVPIGAASLGQVHRARRRRDGLELCLKIQYPDLARSVDSDLNTLSRLLAVSRLAPKGLDLTPMLREVRQMLHQELNYRSELHFTQEFSERLARDPRFVVPRVVPEYSAREVLATSFEPGLDVHDPALSALSQERRNRLGMAFLDLFLNELFEWRMVQTDPNFGNYLFRAGASGEDTIVLLDFGATRTFTPAFVNNYREVVCGALLRDLGRIVRGASALEIMKEDFPRSVHEGFARMCELIVEPFEAPGSPGAPQDLWNAAGEYRWADTDLPARVSRAMALSMLTLHYRQPPRDLLFLNRRLAGVFMMLRTLRAELNARRRLNSALNI